MSNKTLVADIKLLIDEENAFHVESQVFNDDEVSPEDLVKMMGLGVWDTLKKSLWDDAAKGAKDAGVTPDKWDEFVEQMDRLVELEVETFMHAVISAGVAPLGLSRETGMADFENLLGFVKEFVAKRETFMNEFIEERNTILEKE